MSGFWVARGLDGHYEVLIPPPIGIKGVCGPTVVKIPVLPLGAKPVFIEMRREGA